MPDVTKSFGPNGQISFAVGGGARIFYGRAGDEDKYHLQRVRKANAKGHIDEKLERARVEVLQDDINRAARSRKRRK